MCNNDSNIIYYMYAAVANTAALPVAYNVEILATCSPAHRNNTAGSLNCILQPKIGLLLPNIYDSCNLPSHDHIF